MRVNEIAAEIHRRMCEDDRFGYSWEERYGASEETWWIDGKAYTIRVGDYDCSSSFITAWRLALMYTAYAGVLDGAVTTHNISAVFCASGLFERMPMSFLAETGDGYLNDQNHVAMCQTQYPDVLSEFSWGDNGAYGNQRGDQTGWEASVHGYYEYPWDCIIHYNGAADGTEGGSYDPGDYTPSDNVQPQPGNAYWQGEMIGLSDTTGSGDDFAGVPGLPILNIAIEGVGPYQVSDTVNGDFWPTVDHYDLNDPENGYAGNDCPVDRLRIFDPSVKYQLHELNGEWHAVMQGTTDTGGSGDDFAGESGTVHDLVRIWRDGGDQPRYNVFS